MSDVADRADPAIERILDAGLARHRARAAAEALAPANTSGTCADCGDAIDRLRLAANPRAARCVECQTFIEIARDRNASG